VLAGNGGREDEGKRNENDGMERRGKREGKTGMGMDGEEKAEAEGKRGKKEQVKGYFHCLLVY